MTSGWALGIDIGGTGSRIALEPVATPGAGRRELRGERIGVGSGGSSVPAALIELVDRARAEWPAETRDLAALAAGATGLATLVADPGAVADELRTATGGAGVALAVDAVTAHLGALAGSGGVVVAVGTGSIALGTDFAGVWRRVDGWGHLLGDRGAGSWVGIEALRSAMSAHDGVDAAGTALLGAARSRFGEPETWPAQLYTRQDRAGILAGFAANVAAVALAGDAEAMRILTAAGRAAADSAVAALDPAIPATVSAVGGLFDAGGAFAEAFRARIAERVPGAVIRPAAGSPLDGAVLLAHRIATDPVSFPGRAPYLWRAEA